MSNNIDDFNSGVALILGKLYENFPRAIHLDSNDLAIIASIKSGPIEREEIIRHQELYEIFYHTARFLLAEGYIRGNIIEGRTYVSECTLTTKGLAALQRVPASIQEKRNSIGDFFIEIGKDGLKAVTKEAVTSAVQAIFNG